MKKFIVFQETIKSQTTVGSTTNLVMECIVRLVIAENQETAIGKFVINTQDITAEKKLDIECYDLDKLKFIN